MAKNMQGQGNQAQGNQGGFPGGQGFNGGNQPGGN